LPRPLMSVLARCACGDSTRRQKLIELRNTVPRLRSLYFRRRRLLSDTELAAMGFHAAELDLDEDFLPAECKPEQDLPVADPVAAIGVLESRFYMGNMLLRDADVYGMAHGMEIRVPFLDRRVVETMAAVRGRERMAGRESNKVWLTRALRRRMPLSVLR